MSRVAIVVRDLKSDRLAQADVLGQASALRRAGHEVRLFTENAGDVRLPSFHYRDLPLLHDRQVDLILYHLIDEDAAIVPLLTHVGGRVVVRTHDIAPALPDRGPWPRAVQVARVRRSLLVRLSHLAISQIIVAGPRDVESARSLVRPDCPISWSLPTIHPLDLFASWVKPSHGPRDPTAGAVVLMHGTAEDDGDDGWAQVEGAVRYVQTGGDEVWRSLPPPSWSDLPLNPDLVCVVPEAAPLSPTLLSGLCHGIPILCAEGSNMAALLGPNAALLHPNRSTHATVMELLRDERRLAELADLSRSACERHWMLRSPGDGLSELLAPTHHEEAQRTALSREYVLSFDWFGLPDIDGLLAATGWPATAPADTDWSSREVQRSLINDVLMGRMARTSALGAWLQAPALVEYAQRLPIPSRARHLAIEARLAWRFNSTVRSRVSLDDWAGVNAFRRWFARNGAPYSDVGRQEP